MSSRTWQYLGTTKTRLSLVAILAAFALCIPLRFVLADPPSDQEYVGNKRCASCHFEQYMKWKKDPHSKAFALLTKKYATDAKCLKCHTVGYGAATGFKDAKSTPALTDVGCEDCHGPGSVHDKIAEKYAQVKNLTKEQEAEVRGSIWKVLPKNVCIECHTTKAHKDSETPPELRKKK